MDAEGRLFMAFELLRNRTLDELMGLHGRLRGAPRRPLRRRALFAVFGLGTCTVNDADPAADGGSLQGASGITGIVRNGRGDMPDFDTSLVSADALDTMFPCLGSFPKPTDGAGLFQRFCSNRHGGGGGLGEEAGELRGVVRGGVGSNPGSGESEGGDD